VVDLFLEGTRYTAMDIYWLEQTESDVPANNNWLSPHEAAALAAMRFLKRRSDWRLGRWTAKQALAACFKLPTNLLALADLEIRAASSGAPEVFLHGDPADIAISLSHRAGTALCTLGPPGRNFGCDLEMVEPRSAAFVDDYFTAAEKALIADTSPSGLPLLLALLWSGKESALKALRVGLRLDTRCMSVSPGQTVPPHPYASLGLAADSGGWYPLRIHYSSAQTFSGWWRLESDLVRTVVSDAPFHAPLSARERTFDHQSQPALNPTTAQALLT
jgi:4'-phosphopantetheinyl transferase